MKNGALLVIDIQKDFTLPSGRLPVESSQAEQIISNINRIIGSKEADGLLPLYIGNEFRKCDPLNLFRNFCALQGSEGSKLDPRLKIVNSHYFAKQRGNAFSNAALASFLRSADITHVYLSGLFADACVFRTFEGARKLGLACSVVSDAIAAKTAARRQKMVEKFSTLGAEIVSTEQLLRQK
ncbi:MAG: cysteine hydrolase family protein [Stenotrophobium sp.]